MKHTHTHAHGRACINALLHQHQGDLSTRTLLKVSFGRQVVPGPLWASTLPFPLLLGPSFLPEDIRLGMAEEIQPGGDGGDSTQHGFAWQRIDLHFH